MSSRSWFYRLRNQLLDFELRRAGAHRWRWEKKGSALLTTSNVVRYPQVTRAMRRILSKIQTVGGFVVYVGFEKRQPAPEDNSRALYGGVLRRILVRLNRACTISDARFLVVLDDNDPVFSRDVILLKAQQVMFGRDWCSRLVEVPLQVESVTYHSVQCADWICGLLGRYASHMLRPAEFSDFAWAKERFEGDLRRVTRHSRILTTSRLEADRTVARATVTVH